MKLKTEMVHMDGKWSVGVVSGFSDEAQARARKDVSHDAMAAHAHKQAEREADALFDSGTRWYRARAWINTRAAEILAGWLGEE